MVFQTKEDFKTTARSFSHGFTLVELAVVLIIIGILTAGVLKGQELLNNARVTGIIADTRTVMTAFTSFRDKFDALPGDMIRARERLQNCSAATNCQDGGTRIGPPASNGGLVYRGGDGIVGAHGYLNDQSQIDQEATQFWKHLLLADLITGVTTSSFVGWGESHPAIKGAGGFVVQYTVAWPQQGHWLRLQNAVSGNPLGGDDQNAVSPLRASQIDRKMDDSNVTSGTVVGKGTGCGGAGMGVATGEYDETEQRKNCLLFFKFY